MRGVLHEKEREIKREGVEREERERKDNKEEER